MTTQKQALLSSPFTEKKSEAQGGEIACLRSHNCGAQAELVQLKSHLGIILCCLLNGVSPTLPPLMSVCQWLLKKW